MKLSSLDKIKPILLIGLGIFYIYIIGYNITSGHSMNLEGMTEGATGDDEEEKEKEHMGNEDDEEEEEHKK